MSLSILDIPIQSSTVTPSIVEGDTIPAIVISSADFPDLTTSTIKLQVYYGDTKYLDLTNSSGITVDSSTQFTIDAIAASSNTFSAGQYLGDLEITDASGVKTTYFQVRYTIDKQYTV